MPGDQILIDSDAFIGLVFRQDAHHERVRNLWRQLQIEQVQFITSNLVITETATMLSRRISLSIAQQFLQSAQDIQTIIVDDHIHQLTVDLFQKQQREHTSFVDLSNVVILQELKIKRIFSFDKVYTKDFGLTLVS